MPTHAVTLAEMVGAAVSSSRNENEVDEEIGCARAAALDSSATRVTRQSLPYSTLINNPGCHLVTLKVT